MNDRSASGQELAAWFATPPGRYLLDWEREQFDRAVADRFGYHALQLGLPELATLRANRMPHRWLALPESAEAAGLASVGPDADPAVALVTHAAALPFAASSLDLLVLPHTLELSADPHAVLREAGDFIAPWRVHDWLHLLSFEPEFQTQGCWRPAVRSETWLQRWAWIDRIGPHGWPLPGAVYFLVAVKRVRGMHLLGPAWKPRRAGLKPVAVAQKHPLSKNR